jgi:uncharacterized lipoprotein YddW (UPF0748 family)
VGYLWVVRGDLLDRESISRVVERAREMGVRGLLVQVVGRGDAYYRSDLLPRPEALRDATLDPLGELLPLARAAGLEVHAWMNCTLVWSAPKPPRDARHVLRQHPEWVVRLRDGRSMARLSAAQRRRLGIEGIFLNPAHPEVRTWVARIAQEIVTRYPVDGIHLDYIRDPAIPLVSDPQSRAGFALESGVDPERIGRLPVPRRAAVDSMWVSWQGDQVTGIVREVRDSLTVVRPGIGLSAAVIADTVTAERHRAQPWTAWVRAGLIDRVFVMCYAPGVQTVLDEMLAYARELGTSGRVVPGIAVFNTSPAAAAAKIKAAVALGYRTLALYSYDALFDRAGYWSTLHALLEPAPTPNGAR